MSNNINYLYRLIKHFIDFIKINTVEHQFNFQTADSPYIGNYFPTFNDDNEVNNQFVDHENIDYLSYRYDPKNNQIPQEENNDKNLTIVIVMDNVGSHQSLNDSLSLNYNCLLASNGQNGYDLILKNIPDIVISDVLMTKMDGFELCERIRENSKICHIPIILFTEQNANDHIVVGFEKGADACIAKPLKI